MVVRVSKDYFSDAEIILVIKVVDFKETYILYKLMEISVEAILRKIKQSA